MGAVIAESVYVWKLVSHIEGRTKAKDVRKQGAETIVGHKMVAETGGWRKLYDEKLHDLYSSPNITTVTNHSVWNECGYVACMREKRNVKKFLWENQKEREHFEEQGING